MFYIYVLRGCKVLKNKALLIRTITKMVPNYNKNGLNYYERINFIWVIVIIKHLMTCNNKSPSSIPIEI